MLRGIKKALWVATTPLCLAFLLASPSKAAPAPKPIEDAPAAAAPEGGEGKSEEPTNPIENAWDFHAWGKKAPDGHTVPPPFSMAIVNFCILLFLIGKYAAPNVAKYTRDRHDALTRALAEGARLRDDARAKLEEYNAKVAGLDAEIAKLTADIRREAEAEKQKIIKDAEARAERLKKDADQQIQAEMQRVRVAIEREVVTAAVAMAEKVLREKTNDADQRQLAETFIQKVGARA
jgi:F-type H+-transporting ATPase subunit b